MDLLHENCGGEIEVFKERNYGLCQECGEEGYFRVVFEIQEEKITCVMFYETTCSRKKGDSHES